MEAKQNLDDLIKIKSMNEKEVIKSLELLFKNRKSLATVLLYDSEGDQTSIIDALNHINNEIKKHLCL